MGGTQCIDCWGVDRVCDSYAWVLIRKSVSNQQKTAKPIIK